MRRTELDRAGDLASRLAVSWTLAALVGSGPLAALAKSAPVAALAKSAPVAALARRGAVAALAGLGALAAGCLNQTAPPEQTAREEATPPRVSPTDRRPEDPADRARESPGGRPAPSAETPRRIVSLAPNLTEILFAIGAGAQVAGVTDYCDHPPEARRLPRVGGFVNPNPEAVLALAPDLVVVTPNVGNKPLVDRLMRVGARVAVLEARNLGEVFPAIERLGRETGREAQAAALTDRLRSGIARVRARAASLPPTRVLLCLQIEPLIAAGPGSYPHDLLALAGGSSVVPDGAGPYPALSLEEVLRAAPEVIIQTRMDGAAGAPPATGGPDARLLAWWGRWPALPAVAAGRVHAVKADPLLRPGPRALEGIEMLVGLLHPGLRAREAPVSAAGGARCAGCHRSAS